MRRTSVAGVAAVALVAMGCTAEAPATVTPGPYATAQPAREVEIPVNPPPGGPSGPAVVPPVTVDALVDYTEPEGRYALQVPLGWPAQPQPLSGDAQVGTLFPAPEGNAFVTVTQFDNGQRPVALGSAINQVLGMTGVTTLDNYQELDRAPVIERPGDAMRLELAYNRSDGVPMRSLVLFQIDGTTLSMVNASVEAGSWQANESRLHDIMASYRAPAPLAP